MAGILAMTAIAGCGATPSPVPPTSSSPSPKVSTPLEARGALLALGVFDNCGKPSVSEDITSVVCQIEPSGKEVGLTADRSVMLLYFDQPETFTVELICRTFKGLGSSVVTDGLTFIAVGKEIVQGDRYDWPDEVRPEDIQRALGGEVIELDKACAGSPSP